MAEPTDQFTLLCESCGYPLTGLPTGGNCPECGRLIAESLPQGRYGSAWQQRPRPMAWLATNLSAIRHPGASFRTMSIEWERSGLLFLANITIASALVAVGFALDAFGEKWIAGCFLVGFGAVPVWIGLAILTLIEYAGIQFFGRRSRWRVTSAVAWSVCAHATVGWVVGGGLSFVMFILFTWRWHGEFKAMPEWFEWVVSLGPVAGIAIGLLIFETLVYIGIRRCRFANRMPPAPDA